MIQADVENEGFLRADDIRPYGGERKLMLVGKGLDPFQRRKAQITMAYCDEPPPDGGRNGTSRIPYG